MPKKEFRQITYGGALIGQEEKDAIIKCINKGDGRNWQQGEEGALMEKEACDQIGLKYGILTNSGSSAGLLALSALELPKGSEVIISAVTFPTIFNIILQCGLVPVVVDAKVGTYVFDIDEVEKAITKKTKAIIAVHAVGNPVDWVGLKKVAQKYKIKTILDNCDGWGTSINGKKVETYADISFTSFHAAHIVSMGVGGGVFTNNKELAVNVRMYRDWGRQANTDKPHTCKTLPKDYNPRFVYDKIGYNFQILELQAAMGRVQLRKADKIKKLRKDNFDYLVKHLSKYKDLIMPTTVKGSDVCWFALPLTYTGDRGKLVAHLEKNGIETRSMFAGNITRHPAYRDSKYRLGSKLKEADYILEHSFWIGVHPRYTQEDREYIISVFDEFLGSKS
ncbi:MAG: aminotransferase class I/II-fold pyridoxal phosphate-dependent enzyme [Candidatus Vogelbacteria bacterium]|nr:aminotransferase class I/II-fold pyridoxal phosphate-dependent enzyme [Candidatus Vogelbacteria bacterium]